MIDRKKLLDLMKIPIHPRIGADYAEVVADFIMDNENKIQKEDECIMLHEFDDFDILTCSECRHYFKQELFTETPNFCPYCGRKIKK